MYLYGIFAGSRWGIETNKRRALRLARANAALVTRMETYSARPSVWDAPTFRLLSSVIADFRPGKH